MKRCPQCNQVAIDEALTFCRADGVRFVQDSGSFNDRETVIFQPEAPVAVASITDESFTVPVAATTLLDSSTGRTSYTQLDHQKETPDQSAVVTSVVTGTFADWAYYSLSSNSGAPIYSIAVLPFINVNAGQQFDDLSDGLTEMLICNLSRLPKLNVKARSSVFRYKGKDVTPHTVGADLNVQAVLNGRIAQRGDVLTLSLELADAYTENIIWSVQYHYNQTDLVSLQSEIARDVSNNLQVKLAGVDEQKLSKTYRINTEVCQLYWKGRLSWNKRTLKDLEKALEYYHQAIALDPNYALAYAGLADTYVMLPFYRKEPLCEAMPMAREATIKALSPDSDL
jgi:TolB-like protein